MRTIWPGRRARTGQHQVPIASIVFLEPSAQTLDTPLYPLYLMEKVNGHVIRDVMPPGYAEAPEDRR